MAPNCHSQDGWKDKMYNFKLDTFAQLTTEIDAQYTSSDIDNNATLTTSEASNFLTAIWNTVQLGTPSAAEITEFESSTDLPMPKDLKNVKRQLLQMINKKITTGYPGNKTGVILAFFTKYATLE